MSINSGLRIGDLLALRVGQVANLKVGDSLKIRERKTGKINVLLINKSIHKALKKLASTQAGRSDLRPSARPHDFLFKSGRSGRSGNRPLTIDTVCRLVKHWCEKAGCRGQFSARTLRKTWAYTMRVHYGVPIDVLCRRFNHSSPAVTMLYAGIEDGEVQSVLLNEL